MQPWIFSLRSLFLALCAELLQLLVHVLREARTWVNPDNLRVGYVWCREGREGCAFAETESGTDSSEVWGITHEVEAERAEVSVDCGDCRDGFELDEVRTRVFNAECAEVGVEARAQG